MIMWIIYTVLFIGLLIFVWNFMQAMDIIVKCDACGHYFYSKHGYTNLEHSYCSKCCKW